MIESLIADAMLKETSNNTSIIALFKLATLKTSASESREPGSPISGSDSPSAGFTYKRLLGHFAASHPLPWCEVWLWALRITTVFALFVDHASTESQQPWQNGEKFSTSSSLWP
jgi:hypothetical protein